MQTTRNLQRSLVSALAALFAASAAFAEDVGTVTVSGLANLYGAGHASPPDPDSTGAGTLPPWVSLTPGEGRTVRFSNVIGSVDYGLCCEPNLPEGDELGLITTPIWGGIAGPEIARGRHLSGVFLSDAEPSNPAPDPLFIPDISFGSIDPEIAQIFFVGDGLQGEGSGPRQVFQVPDGATRLFLGYMDCFPPCTVPGGYDDNSGIVLIDVELLQAPSTPTLASWAIATLLAGLAGTGAMIARRRTGST